MTRGEFLRSIWSAHPSTCWLFVAARRGRRWVEQPIRNDKECGRSVRVFLRQHNARKWDLYFCPNAFNSPTRKATEAVNTPYAWCDIDGADPYQFEPQPGGLWESSPGRYQGLWVFNKRLRPKRAERLSKHLTYEFGGDPNGWSVTKVLRIPGTYNHKRDGNPPRVKLLALDLSSIDPQPILKIAPKIRRANRSIDDLALDLDRDPGKLFRKHRRQIAHAKTLYLLRAKQATEPDRSRQIFIIIAALFEAGVPWNDIACLVWHNPYFRSKHGTDVNALEAEIQRSMNKLDDGA